MTFPEIFAELSRWHDQIRQTLSGSDLIRASLVMAAPLIYLKSKLLVPPDPNAVEELDEEALALKAELEERLREYARVKTQGVWLAAREAEQLLIWGRPGSTLPPLED